MADVEKAYRILGFNSIECGMVNLVGPFFHKNVIDFNQFIAQNEHFVIYSADWRNPSWIWIMRGLHEHGFQFAVAWNGSKVGAYHIEVSRGN